LKSRGEMPNVCGLIHFDSAGERFFDEKRDIFDNT